MSRRFKILSLNLHSLSYQEALQTILGWGKQHNSSYVCFANVHMTIEAVDKLDFAEIVNGADLVCADGMPLTLGVKKLYGEKIDRIAGMDMFPDLIDASNKQELSIFLYGSTENVLSKIKDKISAKYPAVKVAGAVSPPFRKLSEQEELNYINQINNSGANFVFVALGCPKQEKWMAKHSKSINAVLLGVGGAFPVFSEEQTRAPKWVRDNSLEWFYRLTQDPKRLFKRYFYTNTKFIFLMWIQLFKRKR